MTTLFKEELYFFAIVSLLALLWLIFSQCYIFLPHIMHLFSLCLHESEGEPGDT